MRKLMVLVAMLAMMMVAASAAYALTWVGGTGDDTKHGTDRADTLMSKGGADTLYGEGYMDVLRGDSGNDSLYGGPGEDSLRGSFGDDKIYAGDDDDSDEIRCGPGHDVVFLTKNDHSANNILRKGPNACEEINTIK